MKTVKVESRANTVTSCLSGTIYTSYVNWTVHHCNNWRIKDQLDVICYFISLLMYSTCLGLIYPSSGAFDCAVELPHRSFCSRFVVCWRFGAAGFEWRPCCRLQHQISYTQRTENKTTNLVIQQHSRKLLMMDILMSETCLVHKKWNKIASDIKLVFYFSTPFLELMSCRSPWVNGRCVRLTTDLCIMQNSDVRHPRCVSTIERSLVY